MNISEFLKKRWLALLLAVIVLAGGIFAVVTLINANNAEALNEQNEETDSEKENDDSPKQRIRLDLSALLSDKAGVNTESEFKLTFPKGVALSADVVKVGLKVTPAIDFDLEDAECGLVIKPKTFLQANKVYTFNINLPEQNIKESWAFQTRREFKVISSLPGNKATNVPLNTGIEITFSHSNIQDFEKYFSIEPKVEGRFEMHKNIAVFIPSALEKDTIYTVTIKNDIYQGDSKESLKEDYVFSFQTQDNIKPQDHQEPYLSFYDWVYNFPSDFQPVLEVSASENFMNKPLDVVIYQYDQVDRFIKDFNNSNEKPSWAVIDKARYIPDISGLTPLKTYHQPLVYTDQSYYMGYLMIPESLAEGHYLLVMQSGEIKDYAFLQINDMQLYMSCGKSKSIVWINDMLTGQPVSGAVFEGNGISPASTSEEGVAQVNEDLDKDFQGRSICFKASREGHPTLVVPIYSGSSYWNSPEGTDYKSNWSILYLDRSTYLPSDRVNVWGMMKPRSGNKPPENVTINLVKYIYDYSTYTNNKQILQTVETPLTPRGSYTAKFDFKDLPSESYTVEVVKDGAVVSSSYFYVNRYVKSPYVATLETENKAYFTGETVNSRVGCEFFEGTPVAGYEMKYFVRRYSDYETLDNGNITTDSQGKADIRIDIEEQSRPISWRPMGHALNVSNKNPEETDIYSSEYFDVYPRDVMIETEIETNNGTSDIKFSTNRIDLSKIRETGITYNDGKDPLYKGDAIDRSIRVTLFERYWDKRENGEYYDMISKTNIKTYEYFEVKNALETFEVQTSNGVAACTLNIPDYTPKKVYMIEYETVDAMNRPIKEEDYLTDYDDYWYGYGAYEDYYHLEFEDKEASYKLGEPIDFTLKKNNNDAIASGSILYMVLKEGIVDFWTSQSVEQSMTFTEEFMPNAYIQAVYFDGRLLYPAYERMMRFDSSDRELDLMLETDKESYKPGDTVNAVLKVTDKSGKPVAADVNISVVDEAYFALYDQTVDTLSSLYRSVYDPGVTNTYISYRNTMHGSGGAEGGEGEDAGGGNSVRRNFVDNAFFEGLKTDSKGQATVSFKLPDNLTSWRFTYQAVTDDLMAGSGKTSINTKLPFFVNLSVNETYLTGDAPVLLLKGYGEGIKTEDEVTFKVTVKSVRGDPQTFETKAQAGEFTEVSLKPLTEGIHTVTVEGQSGNYKDAVEKTIQVRKSLLIAKQVDYHTLDKDLKLDTIESYAVLSFYNANLNDYYQALQDLYWSWGNRLDQIAGRNVSQELLEQYFPTDYYPYGKKYDIRPYQMEDGGFALLPYGSSDVELSAKMAAIYTGDTDVYRLAAFFRGIAENPKETPLRVSAAYLGLAALREPVLLELQGFMARDVMTLDEKLYQANALAVLGDLANAEKLYNEISKAYGKDTEPYRYIDNAGDKDDILRWTSLMAMLAAQVDATDKMAYFGYIEQLNPDEILINLERLFLVKQGLPYVSKESSFAIEIDGKKETIKLKGTEQKHMMLSPENLKTLSFSNIKGNVALSVSYENAQDPSQNTNPIASIARTYNKSSSSPVVIGRTDVVQVRLDITFKEGAPEGFYEITDVLPAGLHYISPYQYEANQWYYGEPDGQRVKLGLYYDGKNNVRNVVYSARVSAPGNFTADHAMVKHWESDACGYSQRTDIQIR